MQTCEALTKSNKKKGLKLINLVIIFQQQPANYILKSTELLRFILKTITGFLRQNNTFMPAEISCVCWLLVKYAEILVRMETFYKHLWKNKIREKSSIINV